MSTESGGSELQKVIDAVEALPIDDQMLVIEIVRRRLIENRRAELVAEVAEARAAYRAGDVRRGSVDDLLGELDRSLFEFVENPESGEDEIHLLALGTHEEVY